jgi:ligand-binding sensor domain-containing protein/AraC-like DNA-binding protein
MSKVSFNFKWFIIIYLISNSILLYSQKSLELQQTPHSFLFINEKQGLNVETINNISQDSIGLLWLCTNKGLYKYDGFRARPVVFENKEINKILSSNIKTIFKDSKGFWWISTFHGLVKYNNYDGKGIIINLNGTKDLYINTVNEDMFGRIWINAFSKSWAHSKSKIYVLNNTNFTDTGCIKEINTFCNEDYQILSNKKNIWVIEYNRILKINPKIFTIEDTIFLKTSKGDLFQSAIYFDNNNSIWISYIDGLLLNYNIKTKTIDKYNIKDITHNSSACIYYIYSKTNDKLWFSIDKEGYWYFDYTKQKFIPFITQSLNKDEIPSYQEGPLFIDRENNYWFGMFRNGLAFTNSNLNCTQSITIKGAPNCSISAIYKASNKHIWIGTDGGGLFEYDSLFNCIKQYTKGTSTLTDNSILTIFEDSKKRLWIGTYIGGLFLYNKTTNNFKNYRYTVGNKNGIVGNDIRAIKEDKKGKLWIVANGTGVSCFDPEKEDFINYTSFNSPWILDLLIDTKGTIWLASSNGISRKTPSSPAFSNSIEEHIRYNFPVNIIKNLCEDNNQTIWIGTDNGMYCYSENGKESKPFEIPFFKGYEIKSITKTNKGELFIATNFGLYKYTIASQNSIRINTSKNTIGEMFVVNSNYFDTINLLLGTSKGLFNIATAIIANQKTEVKPIITDIKLFNNSLFPLENTNGTIASPASLTEINLKYYENNISFEFAYPTFKNIAVDYQFEYMLEGADKQWHKTTSNDVDYPNISPGNYEFKVRVITGNDRSYKRITSIRLIISPPFWKTWWFALFVSIILIIIGLVLIRQRLQRLKKQAFLLEMKVFERTQQILAQKDEIIIQSEKVKDQTDQLKAINDELVKTNLEQTKIYEIASQRNNYNSTQGSLPKSHEEKILENTIAFINEHINDVNLSVVVLSDHAKYSRAQFHRIIKNLTELTPVDLIQTIRLQKAKELVSTGKYTISEVCYLVGFNNPKYFSKRFKEYYSQLPSYFLPK